MFELRIPESEYDFTFARSSGPGGQNVNKVNSKAVLRWNAFQSQAMLTLPVELRLRILEQLSPKLTLDGDVIVSSDTFRDQPANKEDCVRKLHELLRQASYVPKKRKPTKPTRSSRQKRLSSKTLHSQKKSLRSRKPGRDW